MLAALPWILPRILHGSLPQLLTLLRGWFIRRLLLLPRPMLAPQLWLLLWQLRSTSRLLVQLRWSLFQMRKWRPGGHLHRARRLVLRQNRIWRDRRRSNRPAARDGGSGASLRDDATHHHERQHAAEEPRPLVPLRAAPRRLPRPRPRCINLAPPALGARASHCGGKTGGNARLLARISAAATQAVSRPQSAEPHAQPRPHGRARPPPPPLARRSPPRAHHGRAARAYCSGAQPGDGCNPK